MGGRSKNWHQFVNRGKVMPVEWKREAKWTEQNSNSSRERIQRGAGIEDCCLRRWKRNWFQKKNQKFDKGRNLTPNEMLELIKEYLSEEELKTCYDMIRQKTSYNISWNMPQAGRSLTSRTWWKYCWKGKNSVNMKNWNYRNQNWGLRVSLETGPFNSPMLLNVPLH